MSQYAIQIDDVREASQRINDIIHRTPVLTCETISAACGKHLFFKAEVFQKSGSFKIRGASNAIFALADEEAARGVVTHSSGNHAAAVALAAKLRGVPAHIVVPRTTPQVKMNAVEAYGGKLYLCEPTIDARESECAKIQAATGAAFVHPYNDPRVMAGQGTIALEFLEQVPQLDAIVVPISGGGMVSGIAVVAKAIKPSIKVFAAEPVGTNDAADVAASKSSGSLVANGARPITIADGLQGRMGSNTWPVIRDLIDGVITVEEAEIVHAMKLIFQHVKVVVEPSGAVGLAAVLKASGASPLRSHAGGAELEAASVLQGCQNVGIILCGGNLDFDAKGFWDMGNWKPSV